MENNNENLTLANVSPQMAEKFAILDELIEQKYVTIQPVHNLLPSLFRTTKTENFKNAPKELRNKSKKVFFSWYAFFFALFAYVQTKLEKDFFIVFAIYIFLSSLLPPIEAIESISTGLGLFFSFWMSHIFVASRYQQYRQFGRVSNNRNFLMTILIAVGFYFLAIVLFAVVNSSLYASSYTE